MKQEIRSYEFGEESDWPEARGRPAGQSKYASVHEAVDKLHLRHSKTPGIIVKFFLKPGDVFIRWRENARRYYRQTYQARPAKSHLATALLEVNDSDILLMRIEAKP